MLFRSDNLDKLDNWSMTQRSEPEEDNGYIIRFTTYENSAVKSLGDADV